MNEFDQSFVNDLAKHRPPLTKDKWLELFMKKFKEHIDELLEHYQMYVNKDRNESGRIIKYPRVLRGNVVWHVTKILETIV